jgi:hypothetical protein
MERPQLLKIAAAIIQEYADAGYNMTLRQLYYQILSRGHCESSQKEYKRLGDILSAARQSGALPPDCLVDTGREVAEGSAHLSYRTQSAEDLRRALVTTAAEIPDRVWEGTRFGADRFVLVAVEKAALAGVIEPEAARLGVAFTALRGYASVSLLWQILTTWDGAARASALARLHYPQITAARPRVLSIVYLGDHDPDGLEIPDALQRGLDGLLQVHRDRLSWLPEDAEIQVKRAALTLRQIRQHDLIPFPAKQTSARFASYYERTGQDEAWELDSLAPPQLIALIRAGVGAARLTQDRQDGVQAARADARATLRAAAAGGAIWQDPTPDHDDDDHDDDHDDDDHDDDDHDDDHDDDDHDTDHDDDPVEPELLAAEAAAAAALSRAFMRRALTIKDYHRLRRALCVIRGTPSLLAVLRACSTDDDHAERVADRFAVVLAALGTLGMAGDGIARYRELVREVTAPTAPAASFQSPLADFRAAERRAAHALSEGVVALDRSIEIYLENRDRLVEEGGLEALTRTLRRVQEDTRTRDRFCAILCAIADAPDEPARKLATSRYLGAVRDWDDADKA